MSAGDAFVEVDQEKFFAVIGPLDVHPSISGSYDQARGYHTDWKTRTGEIVGRSHGGTQIMERHYELRRDRT